MASGRILGHEAVGTIDEVGSAPIGISRRATGCSSRASRPVEDAASAVRTVSGSVSKEEAGSSANSIDGTQAEKVRVPFVDTSAYPVPARDHRRRVPHARRHLADGL